MYVSTRVFHDIFTLKIHIIGTCVNCTFLHKFLARSSSWYINRTQYVGDIFTLRYREYPLH